jgi:hypothetical protein
MNSSVSNYDDASFGRPSMDSQLTINQQEIIHAEPTITLPPPTITYSNATIKGNQTTDRNDVTALFDDSTSVILPTLALESTPPSSSSTAAATPANDKQNLASSPTSSGPPRRPTEKKVTGSITKHNGSDDSGEVPGHIIIENPDLAHLTEAQRKVVLEQTYVLPFHLMTEDFLLMLVYPSLRTVK